MTVQKQDININFAQGLDQKTDPFQVQAGKFLSLKNSIFDKAGRLTKRNGYGPTTALPDATSTLLTTFNGNLTAIGNDLKALSDSSNQWFEKGTLQPIKLSTQQIYRSSQSQIQADTAVAPNGLLCTVFTETDGTTLSYRYTVLESATTQSIIGVTDLPNADPTYGTPRVFVLGSYFVILYTALVTGTARLRYIAISYNDPTVVTAPVQIAQYIPASTVAFDGVVYGDKLYIAYNTTTGGQSVRVTYLSSTLTTVTPTIFVGQIATMFSLAVDSSVTTAPKVYISYYDLPSTNGHTAVVDQNLNPILAPTQIITGETIKNLTSYADLGKGYFIYEIANTYGYNSVKTNYLKTTNITQSGTVGAHVVLVRSLGLYSKAFQYAGNPYVVGVQASDYQNTYFLIDQFGQVVSRLAYSNGSGYALNGLSSVSQGGTSIHLSYLYAAQIQASHRAQGDSRPPIYAQLGINLVNFNFTTSTATASEIGRNLNISGGILWGYDGVKPTENNFFLFPENLFATPNGSGGTMADQQYFYQAVYEWTDAQGNLFRSTPSIPLSFVMSGGGGAGSANVYIPTLRLTYKIEVPVRLVLYRWSIAQQEYFQVTSITAPILNDTSVDYVLYVDTQSDADILGNNLIYTTGGVLEDTAPQAPYIVTLFDNRLWCVSSEDRNLLQFSKQVIEDTPVEMSDLLTIYAAPNTGSQGSTGAITAFAPMDDKLVIWKNNALGYINGTGPDNLGSNSQYSEFTLINGTVGCQNQQSIVFIPTGLMFQSNKGIWLLDRSLNTSYIGMSVENETLTALVTSAQTIPGTNQVRFTMDSGVTLMYDYFYNQWSTFSNVPAISSTLYQNLHTYIDKYGRVFQETPGSYLDNTSPVLMSFTTSWFNLAGLQGYQRIFEINLLGQYLSPFLLDAKIAYNYNSSASQSTSISPVYPGNPWGGEALWGSGSAWGGQSRVFESRLFPQIQKCESFQLQIDEVFDSSLGQMPGAGLTLSGMDLVIGMLKGRRNNPAARSFG